MSSYKVAIVVDMYYSQKMKKKGTREKKSWFGAKCVFAYPSGSLADEQLYEERVILLKAIDFDEAIALAEKEARSYATSCIYTGFVNVFQISAHEIVEGTEVYSLMRSSELDSGEYLNYFHDIGTEKTRNCQSDE